MRISLVLALVAALVVAAPVSAKVRKLEANMSGANEINPAGDPNGTGTAKLRLDRARKKVCFTIRVKNIADPFAAHIHKGRKNVASGPIVVTLFEQQKTGNKFTGCAKNVAKKKIRAILRHPRRYYVNVHNGDFPAGAIRGQLHRP